MEVHHHPHVEKKRFKEYFLEFLMIFLAVTLGFFAENIRENIAKHERERQLMVQMVEDLKRDTADMHFRIQITQKKVYAFDTLIDLIFKSREGQPTDSALQKMYYLYDKESKGWGFHEPTTRAINQLDKENGFSFLRKKDIADTILAYKDLNQISLTLSERFRSRQEDARICSQNIFDYELLSDSVFISSNFEDFHKKISLTKGFGHIKFELLTRDFKTLSIYGAKLTDAIIVLNTYLRGLQKKDKCAIRLINAIIQQYGLAKE
jgi:hypothetical protein